MLKNQKNIILHSRNLKIDSSVDDLKNPFFKIQLCRPQSAVIEKRQPEKKEN